MFQILIIIINQLIYKKLCFISLHFPSYSSIMSSHYKAQPLPKFGEWDVNNPASAEGFTAIFNIARDEKRTGGKVKVEAVKSQQKRGAYKEKTKHKFSIKRKWFCCA